VLVGSNGIPSPDDWVDVLMNFATSVWVASTGESVWITIGVVINGSVVSSGPLDAGILHPDRSTVNNTIETMTIPLCFVIEILLHRLIWFD
jgi:hypothetical protein